MLGIAITVMIVFTIIPVFQSPFLFFSLRWWGAPPLDMGVVLYLKRTNTSMSYIPFPAFLLKILLSCGNLHGKAALLTEYEWDDEH